MKALLFETFGGVLSVAEVPDPTPVDDGVVIQVRASGLCRSDWHGWKGHDPDVRLPHVPGHEFSGVVAATGPEVRQFRVGDRVTVPFCVGCGRCEWCLAGDQQVCPNYFQPGFTAWGSFAEYVAIPHADANLVRLPESLGFAEAASLGCRFVTAYRALVHHGQLVAGQWLAVHGCGGVGLAAIQIGVAHGARVIAIDVHEAALDWARRLGAEHVIQGDELGQRSRDVVRELKAVTGGGAHVSVDAIGGLVSCLQSVRSLRRRGRHVQVGLMVGDQCQPPIPMHVVIAQELTLAGSHGMSATAYGPMLEEIAAGQLRPGQLVAESISLEQVAERLPRLPENRHAGVSVVQFA